MTEATVFKLAFFFFLIDERSFVMIGSLGSSKFLFSQRSRGAVISWNHLLQRCLGHTRVGLPFTL